MTSNLLAQRLLENLRTVQERMRAAAERFGRNADSVRLIAVTKYTTWPAMVGLAQLGVDAFGENRPQQLMDRAAALQVEHPAISMNWHLIGQLQRNKVRSVLPVASLIHSVDSLRLLERIDQIAGELALCPRVLLQVNVSREETKSGFTPGELRAALLQASKMSFVSVVGLMTMAPQTEDEEMIRESFRGLRALRDECASPAVPLRELSMGMSGDFEIAIEEGATLIRVGSALFDGCEGLA